MDTSRGVNIFAIMNEIRVNAPRAIPGGGIPLQVYASGGSREPCR